MPPATLHIAIIGVGLVGKAFIKQLSGVPNLRIVYLANSSHALFNHHGIPLLDWAALLQASASKPDLPALVKQLSGLRSMVVVDNTSSDQVAALYPSFLLAGFHVVTPNKKAYSSSRKLYEEIIAASEELCKQIFFEATVGAGLPIISTLKDLVATGDEIIKIEGVLSGTLSYIFNEFSTIQGSTASFSSIVSVAREKGYTEPHPADDLNGADVARKLTILSRLIPSLRFSLAKGYQSVAITSLVPDELKDVTTGDEFIRRLPEFDAHFETLREEAVKDGFVLRYVGVIDVKNSIIKASLEKYPTSHPFATSLGGSDNIIAFHTTRYSPRPLIIQGAGAGADVTAMGVLSDVLKVKQLEDHAWSLLPGHRR